VTWLCAQRGEQDAGLVPEPGRTIGLAEALILAGGELSLGYLGPDDALELGWPDLPPADLSGGEAGHAPGDMLGMTAGQSSGLIHRPGVADGAKGGPQRGDRDGVVGLDGIAQGDLEPGRQPSAESAAGR
jgi:hypothetical protein